jgi:hypothetical protein
MTLAMAARPTYTGDMDDTGSARNLDRLISYRDEAYNVMRSMVPQLDRGPVDRGQLTTDQCEAMEMFERLEAVVHNARDQRGPPVR